MGRAHGAAPAPDEPGRSYDIPCPPPRGEACNLLRPHPSSAPSAPLVTAIAASSSSTASATTAAPVRCYGPCPLSNTPRQVDAWLRGIVWDEASPPWGKGTPPPPAKLLVDLNDAHGARRPEASAAYHPLRPEASNLARAPLGT